MPQDFGQNNAGNSKSMTLNLDALGDVANQAVNMGQKETPILEKEIEAEVIGADFRMMNNLQSNQNNPENKYYTTIFSVETRFSYEKDGETIEATSRDNYGGLRAYPKMDDNGSPMLNAVGEPVLERLWSGDSSAFGKLFALVQQKDKTVRSYSDFFNFFKKEGLKVRIRTEYTSYQGKQKAKNVIQSFL